MITSLTLAGVPPYDGTGVKFTDLRRVNFIFGGNGSGKSTLSRGLAAYSPGQAGPLSLVWDGGTPCAIEVYNEDFKRKAFFEDDSVPGVFTLGSEDAEKRARLSEIAQELAKLRTHRRRLEDGIGTDDRPGRRQDMEKAWRDFQDTAWRWYKSVKDDFKPLLTRLHQKVKFATRVVREHERFEGMEDPPELSDLVRRATSVLDEGITTRSLLPLPSFEDLNRFRDPALMNRAIVAASDVHLAGLVDRLGSSDWVKQGIAFQAREPATCVFCQQPAPDDLLAQLNALFDGAYEEGVRAVQQEARQYEAAVEQVRRVLGTVLATPEVDTLSMDRKALKLAVEQLHTVMDSNIATYRSKLREPSRALRVQDESDAVEAVLALLVAENKRRDEHNALVANRAEERSSLEDDLWLYLSLTHHDAIAAYRSTASDLDKGIKAIERQIDELTRKIQDLETEESRLNEELGSTLATVEAINATLRANGFRSFHLVATEDYRQYRIVRPGETGSDVPKSLSEGERTLLAFLYFYQRVRDGAVDARAVGANRVVVIDDPIASVDSDVMFMVAHLVRDLADRAAAHVQATDGGGAPGCVQQLFVLTHNAHFHHAATHVRGRRAPARSHESFWTLAKTNGTTTEGKRHKDNPVSTTYEMLWREVREGLSQPVPPVSLRNAMRRIVEFYFVELGTCWDLHAVASQVREELRPAALSLVNWMHDGSHGAFGDAHAPASPAQVGRYAEALKALFEANGSEAHWDAMMNPPRGT